MRKIKTTKQNKNLSSYFQTGINKIMSKKKDTQTLNLLNSF